MVVFSHAQGDAQFQAIKLGEVFTRNLNLPWVAGVDLFFVTSGFIMVHASNSLFATPGAPRAFLMRRLARIAPLYWLVTLLGLGVALFAARSGKEPFPAIGEILGSFGFVPYADAHGEARPIAGQGWTLNYEMFFYALFAIFVGFPRGKAVAGVALALGAIVSLGAVFKPRAVALQFWSDPIVLEFALGMGIAIAWRIGLRFSRPVALDLAVLAVAWLALDFDAIRSVPLGRAETNGFWRLLGCGAPMAALFAAAVLIEPSLTAGGRAGGFGCALGDASYSLYLTHPLVIVITRKAYLAAHLDAFVGLWPLVATEMFVAAGVAFAVYRFVESPMTRRLQALLGAPRSKTSGEAGAARSARIRQREAA